MAARTQHLLPLLVLLLTAALTTIMSTPASAKTSSGMRAQAAFKVATARAEAASTRVIRLREQTCRKTKCRATYTYALDQMSSYLYGRSSAGGRETTWTNGSSGVELLASVDGGGCYASLPAKTVRRDAASLASLHLRQWRGTLTRQQSSNWSRVSSRSLSMKSVDGTTLRAKLDRHGRLTSLTETARLSKTSHRVTRLSIAYSSESVHKQASPTPACPPGVGFGDTGGDDGGSTSGPKPKPTPARDTPAKQVARVAASPVTDADRAAISQAGLPAALSAKNTSDGDLVFASTPANWRVLSTWRGTGSGGQSEALLVVVMPRGAEPRVDPSLDPSSVSEDAPQRIAEYTNPNPVVAYVTITTDADVEATQVSLTQDPYYRASTHSNCDLNSCEPSSHPSWDLTGANAGLSLPAGYPGDAEAVRAALLAALKVRAGGAK